ncbi:MAG: 23S rRNA (pseudouridine(1915)-N(3))-methyltransferase RlmH [Thermoanaerobaculia bacterium]
MGRKLLIVWAGRHRRRAWEDLCADYRRRIEHQIPIQDRWIKSRAAGDDRARRKAEGRAMAAQLPDPCWTVALDPRGKALGSEAFARELRRLEAEWPHPIAFLIGSDLGLDEELTAAARQRLSFGPMIFGHQLARLMLYEQIYRSVAIRRGIKYHRQRF